MVEFDQLEDPQRLAALAHDRNYAVTASAGSGKTTTFAARYLKLLELTNTDPRSIAAITFTESGATELEERVREVVSHKLIQGANYEKWRDHYDVLPEAYIHTIHGFCARLLREYAVEASVPIGFDVIEETAARGQRRNAIESFIDDNIEDSRLERLTEIYYRSRLEDLLADLLEEHHLARNWADDWASEEATAVVEFVREQFSPINIDQARHLLSQPDVRDALHDIYQVAQDESAGGNRITIARNVAEAVDLYGTDVATLDDIGINDAAASICQGLTSKGEPYYGDWDSWCYGGHDDWDDENARRYDEATSTLIDELPVAEWAVPERLATDRNASQYYIDLASLFQDLHDRYQERKFEERVLDFTDLIESTIDLLESRPGVRKSIADSFDYVMLDEVQDTDPRQWEIVQLLTSLDETYDGLNVFVVGDEKQSIFRFRGADVSQYRDERDRLAAANEQAALPPLPEVYPDIDGGALTRNFRSLPAVLEPVNDIFDEVFGVLPPDHLDPPPGILSDDSFEPDPQRLVPYRDDPEGLSTGATFVVVPEDGDVREAVLPEDHSLRGLPDEAPELDARALAGEVASLLDDSVERYEITDYEDGNPVEEPVELAPSDIAILLRKRTHLDEYERALADREIPYTVASGIGFYDSTEIVALRNLFKVLLNPNDDLALFSILRSPLFGFEDNRIVSLWRYIDQDGLGSGELWQALSVTSDDDLSAVRTYIEDWRRIAGVGDEPQVVDTWDGLLGRVIDDTGYLVSLSLDERGGQAIANVEKFRDRLRQWSEKGLQTLPAIVDRIDREVDLSSREGEAAIPEDADGVRIMTIHDAKGQEFPAVFVPGISKDFNLRVGYGEGIAEFETIVDPSTGEQRSLLGIRGPSEEDRFEQQDTMLKRRLKFHREREAVAEEKRILYVAATRARDHLSLIATAPTDEASLETVETGEVEDPSSCYDFLAPTIFDEETIDRFASEGCAESPTDSDQSLAIRLPRDGVASEQADGTVQPSFDTVVPPRSIETEYSLAASYLGSLLEKGAPGSIVMDHTGQYVSYTPPDEPDEEVGDSDFDKHSTDSLPRNVFGDILHKAVELRLNSSDDASLQRLAEQFAYRENLDLTRVDDDAITELRQHVTVAVDYLATIEANRSVDEKPVRAGLDNGEVYGDIDRLFITDDAFHIVDYKTNDITEPSEIDERDQYYTWQMKAYAVALHQADPERTVRATLLFTKTDEPRQHVWSPHELDDLTDSLDGEIRSALADYF